MGQTSCRCIQPQQKPMPIKCQLYNQNLLSQFELPNKQNFHIGYNMHASLSPQCPKLPNRYTDLYLILKCMKTKFIDQYFVVNEFGSQKWVRLADRQSIGVVSDKLGGIGGIGGKDNFNEDRKQENISKFCRVLRFIQKNYQNVANSIRPVYVQSLGFAVAKLWCNGDKLQVIVDDFVPADRIHHQVDAWMLILEKAMAKVLGDYEFLQQFSLQQIFTEVTGIPHFAHPSQSLSNIGAALPQFKTFKQALKCDEMLYQTKKFSQQKCSLSYRKQNAICHISFQGKKNNFTVIKMIVPEKMSMSVRIVKEMIKYKNKKQKSSDEQQEEGEAVEVQWFREGERGLYKIGKSIRVDHCIYLNNIFTDLEGVYWILIYHKNYSQKHLNLLTYSPKQLKLCEDFSNNKLSSLIFNPIISRYLQKDELKKQLEQKSMYLSNKLRVLTFSQQNRQYFRIVNHEINRGQKKQKRKNTEYLMLKCKQKGLYMFVEGDYRSYDRVQVFTILEKWVCIVGANKQLLTDLLQYSQS